MWQQSEETSGAQVEPEAAPAQGEEQAEQGQQGEPPAGETLQACDDRWMSSSEFIQTFSIEQPESIAGLIEAGRVLFRELAGGEREYRWRTREWGNFSELARRFGVDRKQVYRWQAAGYIEEASTYQSILYRVTRDLRWRPQGKPGTCREVEKVRAPTSSPPLAGYGTDIEVVILGSGVASVTIDPSHCGRGLRVVVQMRP
jgi:hypothetical protein